jgi:hypothetical protein
MGSARSDVTQPVAINYAGSPQTGGPNNGPNGPNNPGGANNPVNPGAPGGGGSSGGGPKPPAQDR